MKPVLYTIGPFNVYAFGFFLFLSFLCSTYIIWKIGKEELKEEEYLDAFLFTCFFSLVSARILYILFHFNQFGLNILRFILVRETPGLSLLGAVIGGFFALVYYSKRRKLHREHLFDIFSLTICFALILAKIGEQLGGAGFGRETKSFLGIRIIGLPERYHPTELYEALSLVFLFAFLVYLYRKVQREKWPKGTVAVVFLLATNILIFLLEFLKVYPVYLYGLSFRQIAASGFILVMIKPLLFTVRQIISLKKRNSS